jgi:HAMP domain-containing protein
MFNAFHHFRPRDAMAVLRDAVQAGQPIGIFEISERSLRTLVPMFLLVPLLVAITTPFIRPFRWRRLLWTYLVPLVPLACWWDGIVSQLRAYSRAELQDLAKAVGAPTYYWRAGRVPIVSNPGYLTYLIGCPTVT